MTPDELSERIAYWQKIPYDLWDKDEMLEISFALNKLQIQYQERVEKFINDLIDAHEISLTEAETLRFENIRMKQTMEQFTTRKN